MRLMTQTYEVTLCLNKLSESSGWLSNRTIKATLDVSGLSSLSVEQLKHSLSRLKITVKPEANIQLTLLDNSIYQMQNPKGLALAIRKNPHQLWLKDVANEMTYQVRQARTPSLSQLEDFAEIFEFANLESQGRFIPCLLASVKNVEWQNQEWLKILSRAFSLIKKVMQGNNSAVAMKVDLKKNVLYKEFFSLSSKISVIGNISTFTEFSQILISELPSLLERNDPEILIKTLEILSDALEIKLCCRHSDKSWSEREEFLEILKNLENHPNPKINSLAAYNSFLLRSSPTVSTDHVPFLEPYIQNYERTLRHISNACDAENIEAFFTHISDACSCFSKAFSLLPENQAAATQTWIIPFFALRKIAVIKPEILLSIDPSIENLKKMGLDEDRFRRLKEAVKGPVEQQAFSAEEHSLDPVSNELFKKALQAKAPLEWYLNKFLVNNITPQEELAFHSKVVATVRGDVSTNPVSGYYHTRAFLDSTQEKVLLIKGKTGSELTTFAKQLALSLLQTKDNDKYIPIYVPLSRVKVPFNSLISDSLQLYGLSKQDIVAEKILWIFDGYDQIKFDIAENGMLMFRNLYMTNKLQDFGSHKFIITCTENFVKEREFEYFQPSLNPHQFKVMNLLPSSEEK